MPFKELSFLTFRPGQEAQKIFKANQAMDNTQVKTKLIGFGFSLLEGIDPNPENYVCAGIIHTKSVQIGCLLRLEPNSAAQVPQNSCLTKEPKPNHLFTVVNVCSVLNT